MANTQLDREQMTQELAAFVESEANSAKRNQKLMIVVLTVVGFFLIGYFSWLNTKVQNFTEPQNLAKETSIVLEDHMPQVFRELETVIEQSVPSAPW